MRSSKCSRAEQAAVKQAALAWGAAGLVAGVDEAGRGPLAGPVLAAAVILDDLQPIKGLADSKVLTPRRRENSFSRRRGVSTLESAKPLIGCKSSRITAAASTGPASGPRPASSTPATKPAAPQASAACLTAACSALEHLLDRIGGQSWCVALQFNVQRSKSTL